MDSVTGLSGRALRLLAAVVVLGVIAATVATVGRASPGCPEERYGCAASHPGEAVVIGVLVTADRDPAEVTADIRAAIERRGGHLLGRTLRAEVWRASCDAAGGAEGARQLASDPLDAPPAFAVIAVACDAGILPAAQILSDSGVPLVTTAAPPRLPHNARTTVDGSRVVDDGGIEALATLVLDAAERRGRVHEGDVLIPRIPLLELLGEQGLLRGPTR